jgi:hypothetical protein
MKIAKARLIAGGRIGQETKEEKFKSAYDYLELLKSEGETIIKHYEDKGYLVIEME